MSRRITIRLGDEAFGRLQSRCQATGLDVSFTIREAIEKYLEHMATGQEDKPAGAGLVMPAEAFALTGPFWAWSGDLRLELRKRFLGFLALAYSTAKIWPKSPGTREVYAGLLALAHHLGIGGGDRHD